MFQEVTRQAQFYFQNRMQILMIQSGQDVGMAERSVAIDVT
jgi:hypothetical protein